MEKTRRVGVLTKRVIELLELELPEGKDILLGDSNIGHMTTRHPEDFALYGEYIPDILREPDYVAQNKKDNSIEYVREVEIDHVFVKVAVRVSTKGQLFARSVYRLNPNRVRSFIDKGNLKNIDALSRVDILNSYDIIIVDRDEQRRTEQAAVAHC